MTCQTTGVNLWLPGEKLNLKTTKKTFGVLMFWRLEPGICPMAVYGPLVQVLTLTLIKNLKLGGYNACAPQKLELPDSRITNVPQNTTSAVWKRDSEVVGDLEIWKVIFKTHSSYNLPFLPIQKLDWRLRLTFDCHHLNENTAPLTAAGPYYCNINQIYPWQWKWQHSSSMDFI